MRKITAITQLSLDGVMQAPGGPEEDPSNGFVHGGWAMSYGDDVLHKILGETIADEFALLLGRRTYDIFAGYWPHNGDNPIGKAFNRAPKLVATHRLNPLTWENSERIKGDVVEELRRLKQSQGPEFHVWGSSQLLQTLMTADLVDEYRLWIAPVVLGSGKRLFETGLPPRRLSLVESQKTTTGVLINTYRHAGTL
ncbi:MAG: dihydrofolate reductase family protein [Nibricoccus sp.]